MYTITITRQRRGRKRGRGKRIARIQRGNSRRPKGRREGEKIVEARQEELERGSHSISHSGAVGGSNETIAETHQGQSTSRAVRLSTRQQSDLAKNSHGCGSEQDFFLSRRLSGTRQRHQCVIGNSDDRDELIVPRATLYAVCNACPQTRMVVSGTAVVVDLVIPRRTG